MARKNRSVMLALLLAASALNAAILFVNLSLPSRAAVANMDYRAMTADADFKRAVQSIVEACIVDADLGKLRCER